MLYRLGLALGFEYIHIVPFRFPRSYRRSFLERSVTKALALAGIAPKPGAFQFRSKDLASFLGLKELDRIPHDDSGRGFEVLEIGLDQILQDPNLSTLSALKAVIEKPLKPSVVPLLHWTSGMYGHLPKMHRMLDEFDHGSRREVNRFFADRYWEARTKWKVPISFDEAKERIKVTLHIRLGDSTAVEIGSERYYIHGSEIYASSDYAAVLEVDPNRIPVLDLTKYTSFLDRLLAKLGEENFRCIVISDGYEETFRMVQRAYRRGQLDLEASEFKRWKGTKKALTKSLQDRFSKYKNTSMILGETNPNLFRSIHALASSDVVVHGSGGFAFNMHGFFKRPETQSLVINIRDYDDAVFEKIRSMATGRNEDSLPTSK